MSPALGEQAFLVGLYRSRRARAVEEESLEELKSLAWTAGASVVGSVLQELRRPRAATLIGEGQSADLKRRAQESRVDLVIFDEDLSAVQNRNLEEILGVKVIDRTGLILDIFARRARSQEGKIQVELAQLRYLLPRLVGKGVSLSRLAGGIGTRGPGETKLEVDRRRARERISILQRQLEKLKSRREIQRVRRSGVPIPIVSLVGYTNSGKSTLLNALTGARVFVEDKLFATLDPTVRRFRLPSGREVLLADTVGLVRKLPHQLVEAFRATFEEIGSADLLLHVIDLTSTSPENQVQAVEKVLRELELDGKPSLRVWNKVDGQPPERLKEFKGPEDLVISALRGDGLPLLRDTLEARLSAPLVKVSLLIPHGAGSVLDLLYRNARVLRRKDTARGVRIDAEVFEKHLPPIRRYLCGASA